MVDVIIVGAGPAGLSAALILARCRRSVVIIDGGEGRNRHARELHGYLTRDGTPPCEFLNLARADIVKYGVSVVTGLVTYAQRRADGTFMVRYRSGIVDRGTPSRSQAIQEDAEVTSRKILLATGMRDALPNIDGLIRFYGSTVHHCPYCDGWEHRDKRLVAYGLGDAAIGLALALRTWSPHVTACTDGATTSAEVRQLAVRMNVRVCDAGVVQLQGRGDALERVLFHDGSEVACDAMFFNTGQTQRSDLPRLLGCTFKPDGGVETGDRQCTGVPGVYLAGDADKEVQFVIVAASEGATAAVAMNRELQQEDQSRSMS